jgi:carbon storage regulator CsrA
MLKVTVLEIRGARVKLGFDVDKDVPVHRWEVWERLQADGNGSPTLEHYRHGQRHETRERNGE